MKQICVCGEQYEFTEEQLKCNTLQTYCPKCKKSLALQETMKEQGEVYGKPYIKK